MENKHTPGPWKLMPEMTSGFQGLSEVQSENGDFLVRIRGEANARLIAASPELLEACKKARALIHELEPHVKLDILEQAITKAEGK